MKAADVPRPPETADPPPADDTAPSRPDTGGTGDVRLGLRENLGQFSLLVAVNALVGGVVGQERTVVPLMASQVFALQAVTAALTFLIAFGLTKAATNLVAGALADRFGRKPILVAGWLLALPVPVLLIVAPTWAWVVAANVLLGVSQGLTWSTTVIMKIDLVGPHRRGLAMGLNEAAGYGAVALTAFLTGLIAEAYGLRPAPFLLGLAYAGLGLGLSAVFVRETHGHARHEALTQADRQPLPGELGAREVVLLTTLRERSLSAACQAGLVNNLNDGLAWGLLPLYYLAAGLDVVEVGLLAAIYPAVWGLGQLVSGGLSDRYGRKRFVAGGMLLQALAIAAIAASQGFAPWAAAGVVLGIGTAMAYPTLLAVVGDVAHPTWRATAVGTYRFWRDLGFAVGAIVIGLVADRVGMSASIWVVAALTFVSGLVVIVRMAETHRPRPAPA